MQRFAVIGLGRFGSHLARALTRSGAEVIAIDKDRRCVERHSEEVTLSVRLDSTDEDALRAQGVDKVDVAVVGIGRDFEASILTTVTLKSMGVKRICARSVRQTHAEILRRVGADEVIFPEHESAQRWSFKLMAPQIAEKLEFAPGFSLAQYTAPGCFDGKTLLELQLRKKYGVNLIGLRRREDVAKKDQAHRVINVPSGKTEIFQGDLLWLVGSDKDLASMPDV